jgi:Zn-dependent protease
MAGAGQRTEGQLTHTSSFPGMHRSALSHCSSRASRRLQTGTRPTTLLSLKETKSHFMADLQPELIALGFIWYVAFLFSTTCHEAAHALAAKVGGDDTAFAGGQVSLNPVPHIQREPWGMVVIPILSLIVMHNLFGWASAPYDPVWERRHPRRAAWMALAGPATNYTLMLIAALVLRLGWTYHWLRIDETTGRADFATTVLGIFFFLNLLLGTFNLLPVPPLDGSSGIMVFMGESRAQRYLDWLRGNSYAMLGLLVVVFTFRYIFGPIEGLAMEALLPEQLLLPLIRTIFRL